MTVDGPWVIGSMSGSACFIDLGRYMVPDGHALLVADESGVHVNVQPPRFASWTRGALSEPLKPFRPGDFWYSRWENVAHVRVAKLSMVLENSERERCHFTAQTQREMDSFLRELTTRGIRIQAARSVFWDVYRPRRRDR